MPAKDLLAINIAVQRWRQLFPEARKTFNMHLVCACAGSHAQRGQNNYLYALPKGPRLTFEKVTEKLWYFLTGDAW